MGLRIRPVAVQGMADHSPGVALNGEGVGSVKVKLIGKVNPSGAGSTVTFDVHLGGAALFGPIGMVVAAALKGDIRESLNRFKNTFAPA